MELTSDRVAVVTGAASGIGLALAARFARSGLRVVLADIEHDALVNAEREIADLGVDTLSVVTDVRRPEALHHLAEATVAHFGGVDILCNNAGVAPVGDPWFGPLETWEWVMGVNFWGVVHGCRAFLPHMAQRGGHIVNTASIAGLVPIGAPSYDASKHAVVAMSEDLYHSLQASMLPIGVSVLCPGWVQTRIGDAERNFPGSPKLLPELTAADEIVRSHTRRAIAEGMAPAMVADHVAAAIVANRFWVLPDKQFKEVAVARWATVADEVNPVRADFPGMAPFSQIAEEVMNALADEAGTD